MIFVVLKSEVCYLIRVVIGAGVLVASLDCRVGLA